MLEPREREKPFRSENAQETCNSLYKRLLLGFSWASPGFLEIALADSGKTTSGLKLVGLVRA